MAPPPDVPFPRPLYPPSHAKGPVANNVDVIAVKRAISRAGFYPWQQFDNVYNENFAMHGVRPFQQVNGLTATGNYGEATHEHLSNAVRKGHFDEWAFDTTAIRLMEEADEDINRKPEDLTLTKVRNILTFCRLFDGPYDYGGEHDGSFSDDDIHDAFDCSSSVSFVCWRFGILGASRAQTSDWFETWGESGRGKYITIHANEEHVWMEFTLPEGWFRFDTSPHGDGTHGPRVRTRRRSDWRFVHRHPEGF